MRVREPIVAGKFYPDSADACRAELENMLRADPPTRSVGDHLLGGLVPHAGWAYSGPVAACVFGMLASAVAASPPAVVVLFGGVHRFRGREAAVFGSGRWETPIGPVVVDERLAERVLGHTSLIVDDPYAHEEEHSLEVQVPFVRHLFPEAKVLPIMVPATGRAHEVGQAVASTLKAYAYHAIVVGTTDLTHYGPDYGFVPRGAGEAGLRWAKEDNDRRFLDRVCAMESTELVAEASEHGNACSSGAAAATTAALVSLGCTKGIVLRHTTSAEASGGHKNREPENAVGYAGVVFCDG